MNIAHDLFLNLQTSFTKRLWYQHLWIILSDNSDDKNRTLLTPLESVYYLEANNDTKFEQFRFVKHLIGRCGLFIIHPRHFRKGQDDELDLMESIILLRGMPNRILMSISPVIFDTLWLIQVFRNVAIQQVHAIYRNPSRDRMFLEQRLLELVDVLIAKGYTRMLREFISTLGRKDALTLMPCDVQRDLLTVLRYE